ncbi:Cytochrome P [Trema orientale]|uniref:Cytochrome P n=1 Tax=Trema orientale TaxID=63057 RepID=A0A2P5DMX4_TREOI|nr:Cytochrome P [Trema orientale]
MFEEPDKTNVTLRTAFGKSFRECGLDNDVFEDMIHRAMVVLGTFTASDLFPYVGWIVDRLTGLHARLERSFHELDDFFQRVIDEHLNRTPQEGKEDIVDFLLSIEKGQSEFGEVQLTRDCTKAILMDPEGKFIKILKLDQLLKYHATKQEHNSYPLNIHQQISISLTLECELQYLSDEKYSSIYHLP